MGYLTNFEDDVFISYAHNDDDAYAQEASGWVTGLHQDLQQRVRNYLGTDAQFWRDSAIRNNDEFTNKIFNRLVKTATFLSVLTPSFIHSEWCTREVQAFAGHAEDNLGMLIDGERSRIFKAEKMPVERSALPAPMQGTKTYRFYEPQPGQPNRIRELRPLLGDEYSRRYFEQMDELAKDIATLLIEMAAPQASVANRMTVYIAETTSGLDGKAAELRRDLKDRGFQVLPAGDLPYRGNSYRDKVRECLKQAALSVHLVGDEFGLVPEGETKSNVWLQHDLAMERGKDPNFLRLIWTPGEIASSDARQQAFITHLREEAGVQPGGDLLNGSIEELKNVIHEKLALIRKRQQAPPRRQPPPPGPVEAPAPGVPASPAARPAAARSADEPISVYIMCDPADRTSPGLSALRKYLLSQGCEPVLPSANADEGRSLQDHIENLGLCDACLIYYGEGSSEWYDQKLRDLRKYLRGRSPPVLAKGIYVAAPATPAKADADTLEAIVMRGAETFAGDVIASFIQKIRGASAGA